MEYNSVEEILKRYNFFSWVDKARGKKVIVIATDLIQFNKVKRILDMRGLKPDYLCDELSQIEQSDSEKIPVINYDNLAGLLSDDVCVFINSSRARKAIERLRSYRFYNYINVTHSHEDIKLKDLILDNAEKINYFFTLLADNTSKKVLIDLLQSWITSEIPDSLWEHSIQQYFHPQVFPQADDIVIDGGANVGDTALAFSNVLKGNCKIYSFEPEVQNYKDMIFNIEKNHLENTVIPLNYAIGESNCTLRFEVMPEYRGSHKVNPKGDVEVSCVSLDWFCAQNKIKPTLIKFDIEGSELEGLKGAKEIITEYKPRLMISLYHKKTDLWEIPLYIDSLQRGYKFYLTHHDPAPTETMLYAVAE